MLEKLCFAFRQFNDSAPKHRRLVLSPEAVRLVSARSGRELWRVEWNQIKEICAFKVDCITIDIICFGFHVAGSETIHITDEETPGWKELTAELSTRYGIEESQWFDKVAFPAFKENYAVLWKAGEGKT
ncbi:MAG TPA: hypothetical protein PKM59_15895 [Thermodesulfobacteriota bacterium]|nr:hypothetical protein [Thermodesulfobacteriota bacterium]